MPLISREEFLRQKALRQQDSLEEMTVVWLSLDRLIWQQIFRMLPFSELSRLTGVCTSFYQMIMEIYRELAMAPLLAPSLLPRRSISIFDLPKPILTASAAYFDATKTDIVRTSPSNFTRLPLISEQGVMLLVTRLSGIVLDRAQPLLSLRALLQRCVLLLNQGGYLAIARYEGQRCTKHTSVHRYLVRKCAGGRQITRDKSGNGHRKSIGAQIRRDQEKHFKQSVHDLLIEWGKAGWIEPDVPVFLAAPGPLNREYLFFDGSPLCDVSIVHNIPISTNKPCFTEIQKCHAELTQVKFLKSLEPTSD